MNTTPMTNNRQVPFSKAVKSDLFDLVSDFKDRWPLETSLRRRFDDLIKHMVMGEDLEALPMFK